MQPAEQRPTSPRDRHVGGQRSRTISPPIKERMDSIITVHPKGGATSDGDDEDSEIGLVHPGSVLRRLSRTRSQSLNSSISMDEGGIERRSNYEMLEYLRRRSQYPRGPEIVTRLKMRSRRKKTIRTIDGFGTLDGVYQGLPTSSYEIDSPTTEPNSDTDDKKSKGHVGYHPSMVLDETLRLTCQEVEVFLNGGQEVVAKNDDGLTIPHKTLASSIWEVDSDFPITILPREPSREIMSNGHQPETPDSEDGDTGFFMQPSVVALQEMALKVKTPPLMDDMAIESPECVLIVNPEVLFETDVLKSEDDVQDVASPPTTTVLKSSTLPSHEPRALHDVEGAPTLGNHLGLLPNDSLENSSKASSLEVQPPTSYRSDKVTVLSDPLFDQRVDRDTSQPSDLSLSEAETRLTIMRQFLSMEDHDSSLLDMKVSIQNRVFSTHRLLMAMYSQLFLDMYNDGRLKPFCTVVIEDISPEGFNCVLHWINTSILDLKMASVDEVLEVARFLGIKTLIDKLDCLKASSSLSDQDVILLYEHAIRHGLQDLSVEFGRKAAAAFQEILHSKRHLHYTKDQLCLLLSRDDLKIFKESDVFSAACEWLLYAWDARQEWEGQVMSCVRFKLMSPCEMNDLLLDVQNPLTRSYQVVVMMMHALLYRALKAESGVIPLFLGSDQPARTAIEMASSQRLTESVHQQQSPLCAKSPPPLPPTRFLKPLNPHAAATRIQAQYRGHLTRRAMQELEQSAQTIQRVYRGHVVRKELRTLNNASIVVQGAFRRYLSHKRYDLLTAAASNVNAARQSMAASIAVKPRDQPWFRLPVMAAFMCFGGVTNESDGDDVNNIIEIATRIYCYDKSSDTWLLCGVMPQPRAESAACVLGHKIYITGGYDPSQPSFIPLSTGFILNLSTNEWVTLPEMNVARRLHGQASINGKLFVVGGCSASNKALDSVEFYDPALDVWTATTPLEVPRFGAAVVAHRGLIWVCGGVAGYSRKLVRKITDRVDVFDPHKLKWIKFKSLPEPRAFCDLGSVDGSMLLMAGGIEGTRSGGIRVTSTVLAFDFHRNEWRHLLDLRCQRYKARTLYLDPYLIVIGGQKEISGPPLATIECFDLEDKQWIGIPNLPIALHGMCSVVVDQ